MRLKDFKSIPNHDIWKKGSPKTQSFFDLFLHWILMHSTVVPLQTFLQYMKASWSLEREIFSFLLLSLKLQLETTKLDHKQWIIKASSHFQLMLVNYLLKNSIGSWSRGEAASHKSNRVVCMSKWGDCTFFSQTKARKETAIDELGDLEIVGAFRWRDQSQTSSDKLPFSR